MNASVPSSVLRGVRATDLAALPLLERWVQFATVSRDSNLELIDWTEAHLRALGLTDFRRTYDDSGRKCNLWVTLPANNGETRVGGLVLSGHTDVVPVDGQPWQTNPFEVVAQQDRLVGRGVTDMKGFGATVLALVPELLRRGLDRPVHLAFSYDEEVGCIGVRRLITDIVAQGYRPSGCIVGEPTGMQVVIAHKGKHAYRTLVRGFEAHSSLTPMGVNAVEVACEFVAHLKSMHRRLAIQGGTALNIVPKDCSFEFEFRHLPAHDPRALLAEAVAFARDELEPAMHAVNRDTGFRFEERSSFPGLATDEAAEVTTLCKAATGANGTSKVAFGTEAGLFEAAGIPTIVCGPGNIDQAHKPDEFIALEQVALCEEFVSRVLDSVARRA